MKGLLPTLFISVIVFSVLTRYGFQKYLLNGSDLMVYGTYPGTYTCHYSQIRCICEQVYKSSACELKCSASHMKTIYNQSHCDNHKDMILTGFHIEQ